MISFSCTVSYYLPFIVDVVLCSLYFFVCRYWSLFLMSDLFLPWIVVSVPPLDCCVLFAVSLLLCCSFCVPVLVVVGWGWLSRLALGALSTTGMLTWFDTFHYYTTLHYTTLHYTTLHCYTDISLMHSTLFAGFSVSLGPSGPKRLCSLWHLTVGARSGYVFTPQRPPRDSILSPLPRNLGLGLFSF